MIKRLFILMIAVLVANLWSAAIASAQDTKDAERERKAKILVNRLGTGQSSKVIVKLKSGGTDVKGYISDITAEDFAVTNKKTGSATRVRFSDVKKVEKDNGNTLLIIGLAVGIGVIVLAAACGTNRCD